MAIIATNEEVQEVLQADVEYLLSLLESSTYDHRQRTYYAVKISGIETQEEFETIQRDLYSNQSGIDGVINPSQTDIKRHIKSFL